MGVQYISKAKTVYLRSGLTAGCAKERGANGYYKNFSLSMSKMEVLFSRWIARGADCQGGRGGRRERELKEGVGLGVHV